MHIYICMCVHMYRSTYVLVYPCIHVLGLMHVMCTTIDSDLTRQKVLIKFSYSLSNWKIVIFYIFSNVAI